MPEPAVRASKLTIMLAVAVALAAGASACSDDTSDLPPPASAPPASSSEPSPGLDLTPAEQQAVDEARAKFDEFMNAYIEVSTADVPAADTAEDLFRQVERHADGALPQALRSEIIGRWGESQRADGELTWDFDGIVNVDLEYEVDGVIFPTIFLEYCVDERNWVVVDANTGERISQPGGQSLWRFELSWSDDWGGLGLQGWRVVERTELENPC